MTEVQKAELLAEMREMPVERLQDAYARSRAHAEVCDECKELRTIIERVIKEKMVN